MTIREKKKAFVIGIFVLGAISVLFSSCSNKAENSNERVVDEPAHVVNIIDRTEEENLDTADCLEEFYRDDKYIYSFSSIKSGYIEVVLSDGLKIGVKDALESGLITIYTTIEGKLNSGHASINRCWLF